MKLARAWTRWLTARTKTIRKGSPTSTPPRRSLPLRLTPLEDRVTPASVDLSVVKTESATAVSPGDVITYTIAASNAGPGDATLANLTDAFPPAQFSSVSYTSTVNSGTVVGNTPTGTGDINDFLNMTAGASVTYIVSATVATTATGPVDNTANIAPSILDTDTDTSNNSSSVSADLNVDVGVTKAGTPASASPGDTVTYTITVTNAGSSTATNVQVTDALPAGMTAGTFSGNGNTNSAGPLSDTIASLAPGASVVYTETATVNAAASGPLTDTVTVAVPAGQADTNTGNNTAQVSTLVNVDLGITKSVSPAGAAPGNTVTYTFTVTNAAGSGTATNVAVTDTLPTGLTAVSWSGNGQTNVPGDLNDTITSLAPGASVVYTMTATVDNGATLPLTNTATVTADNTADTDTNAANDTATASLLNAVDLSVTKTDNATTAAPGDTVTYTIVASNAGPQDATGASLTDTFPSAEFGSVSFTSTATTGATGNTTSGTGDISDTLNIPSGGSVTYTVTATVATAAFGSLTNTATVTAGPSDSDTNTANNTATDTDTVAPVSVDLSVTKTDGSATTTGGTVTYTITVSNAGPGTATGATLTDTFPAAEFASASFTSTATGGATGNTATGTGDISDTLTVPSGATVVYTVTATLAPDLPGPVTNTATVTAGPNDTDTNTANNTATDTNLIGTTVTLTVSPSPSALGQPVTLTATVTGLGGASPTSGTVEFLSNGTVIGSTALSGTNVATFTTSALPAGTNALSAVFLGTTGAAPSAAAPVLQVVSTSGGGGTGALALTRNLIVGGATNGTVVVYTPNGTGQYAQAATDAPFGNIGTNVRAATGDVDGDGTEDYIMVTGPGTAIRVMVLSGKDGSVLVAPFDPFGGNFTGGGFVAAADFDKDGRAEFVVTPDLGGGPRVSIFSLLSTGLTLRANFFGIDDPNFRGGARSGAGDINGDGTPDLAVAAGFEGGPRVALYNGTSVLGGTPTKLMNDFFVFESTLRNGAFVTVGDIDGDGFGDLIAGAGPGGAPRVLALNGKTLLDQGATVAIASPLANFFVAGNSSDRGGVRVAAKNADGDSKADLVVGSGEGQPSRVRVYLGSNIIPTGEPTPFQDLDPFAGAVLANGVFVG